MHGAWWWPHNTHTIEARGTERFEHSSSFRWHGFVGCCCLLFSPVPTPEEVLSRVAICHLVFECLYERQALDIMQSSTEESEYAIAISFALVRLLSCMQMTLGTWQHSHSKSHTNHIQTHHFCKKLIMIGRRTNGLNETNRVLSRLEPPICTRCFLTFCCCFVFAHNNWASQKNNKKKLPR